MESYGFEESTTLVFPEKSGKTLPEANAGKSKRLICCWLIADNGRDTVSIKSIDKMVGIICLRDIPWHLK